MHHVMEHFVKAIWLHIWYMETASAVQNIADFQGILLQTQITSKHLFKAMLSKSSLYNQRANLKRK